MDLMDKPESTPAGSATTNASDDASDLSGFSGVSDLWKDMDEVGNALEKELGEIGDAFGAELKGYEEKDKSVSVPGKNAESIPIPKSSRSETSAIAHDSTGEDVNEIFEFASSLQKGEDQDSKQEARSTLLITSSRVDADVEKEAENDDPRRFLKSSNSIGYESLAKLSIDLDFETLDDSIYERSKLMLRSGTDLETQMDPSVDEVKRNTENATSLLRKQDSQKKQDLASQKELKRESVERKPQGLQESNSFVPCPNRNQSPNERETESPRTLNNSVVHSPNSASNACQLESVKILPLQKAEKSLTREKKRSSPKAESFLPQSQNAKISPLKNRLRKEMRKEEGIKSANELLLRYLKASDKDQTELINSKSEKKTGPRCAHNRAETKKSEQTLQGKDRVTNRESSLPSENGQIDDSLPKLTNSSPEKSLLVPLKVSQGQVEAGELKEKALCAKERKDDAEEQDGNCRSRNKLENKGLRMKESNSISGLTLSQRCAVVPGNYSIEDNGENVSASETENRTYSSKDSEHHSLFAVKKGYVEKLDQKSCQDLDVGVILPESQVRCSDDRFKKDFKGVRNSTKLRIPNTVRTAMKQANASALEIEKDKDSSLMIKVTTPSSHEKIMVSRVTPVLKTLEAQAESKGVQVGPKSTECRFGVAGNKNGNLEDSLEVPRKELRSRSSSTMSTSSHDSPHGPEHSPRKHYTVKDGTKNYTETTKKAEKHPYVERISKRDIPTHKSQAQPIKANDAEKQGLGSDSDSDSEELLQSLSFLPSKPIVQMEINDQFRDKKTVKCPIRKPADLGHYRVPSTNEHTAPVFHYRLEGRNVSCAQPSRPSHLIGSSSEMSPKYDIALHHIYGLSCSKACQTIRYSDCQGMAFIHVAANVGVLQHRIESIRARSNVKTNSDQIQNFFKLHTNQIECFNIDSVQKMAVSIECSRPGCIAYVWKTDGSMEELACIRCTMKKVFSTSFSPNGSLILILGTRFGQLMLSGWSWRDNRQVFEMPQTHLYAKSCEMSVGTQLPHQRPQNITTHVAGQQNFISISEKGMFSIVVWSTSELSITSVFDKTCSSRKVAWQRLIRDFEPGNIRTSSVLDSDRKGSVSEPERDNLKAEVETVLLSSAGNILLSVSTGILCSISSEGHTLEQSTWVSKQDPICSICEVATGISTGAIPDHVKVIKFICATRHGWILGYTSTFEKCFSLSIRNYYIEPEIFRWCIPARKQPLPSSWTTIGMDFCQRSLKALVTLSTNQVYQVDLRAKGAELVLFGIPNCPNHLSAQSAQGMFAVACPVDEPDQQTAYGMAYIWNIWWKFQLPLALCVGSPITALAFDDAESASDETDLAVGLEDGKVILLQLPSPRLLGVIDVSSPCGHACIQERNPNPDEKSRRSRSIQHLKYSNKYDLCVVSADGNLTVYSKQRKPVLRSSMKIPQCKIVSVDFDGSASLLVTCHLDCTLRYWSLNSGKELSMASETVRNAQWQYRSSFLGWPLQGIFDPSPQSQDIKGNEVLSRSSPLEHCILRISQRKNILLACRSYGPLRVCTFPCLSFSNPKYVHPLVPARTRLCSMEKSSRLLAPSISLDFTAKDEYVVTTSTRYKVIHLWSIIPRNMERLSYHNPDWTREEVQNIPPGSLRREDDIGIVSPKSPVAPENENAMPDIKPFSDPVSDRLDEERRISQALCHRDWGKPRNTPDVKSSRRGIVTNESMIERGLQLNEELEDERNDICSEEEERSQTLHWEWTNPRTGQPWHRQSHPLNQQRPPGRMNTVMNLSLSQYTTICNAVRRKMGLQFVDEKRLKAEIARKKKAIQRLRKYRERLSKLYDKISSANHKISKREGRILQDLYHKISSSGRARQPAAEETRAYTLRVYENNKHLRHECLELEIALAERA